MRIIIEGPPQCGKTTIATVVKERYGLCYISASEAVRSAVHAGGGGGSSSSSAHSATLRQLIDGNERIPDALLVRVVAEATRRPDCVNGFVLDAFPATRRQARLLLTPPPSQQQQGGSGGSSSSNNNENVDDVVRVDAVVELDVAESVLQQRFAGRWLHPRSGRMYHTLYDPPRVPGKDNVTGERLEQRDEDTSAAIAQRMVHYRKQAADLRGVFAHDQWLVADANGSVEEVRNGVFAVVDALRTRLTAHATTIPTQDTKDNNNNSAAAAAANDATTRGQQQQTTGRRHWWQLW